VQPSGSGVWGGGRDATDLLIDRLSALASALDPVPPAVLAGARAAFAAAGERVATPAPMSEPD
jgi:hypothetical protein